MDERLAEYYRGVAVHATADQEHRAALELLALMILADREVAESEVDVVREISVEWRDEPFEFEDHLEPAIARAKNAIDTDTVDEFLDDVDQRINSRVLRGALFSAVREVAGVDDDVTAEEGSLLAAVAVRFD